MLVLPCYHATSARVTHGLPKATRRPDGMRTHHAVEQIKESGRTFGYVPLKSKIHWSWDAEKQSDVRPPKVSGRSEASFAERRDVPRDAGRSMWSPKVVQPDYPTAKQSGDSDRGVRATVKQSVKRLKIQIIDRETGMRREVWTRIITNEINVFPYGKHVIFRKTNRGATVWDSRSTKRLTLDKVRDELTRMLGAQRATVGMKALLLT